MIVSKLLSSCGILARSYVLCSSFSKQISPKSSSIHNQIMEQRTLTNFYNLFQKNKDKFTPELFSFSSKTINSILLNYRQSINYAQSKQILNSIGELDIDSLQLKDLLNLLSIIRHYKMRGISIYYLFSFKNKLASKILEQIKKMKLTLKDLPELFTCYYQITFFKNQYQGKFLADKIVFLLEEGKKQERLNLSDHELSFFLYALSIRDQLLRVQVRIRSILLQIITKNVDTISLSDLVKIAINLNRMQSIDFRNQELTAFKMITNRIQKNIIDLEQKSIYDLIKSEHISRFHGFIKIYQQITNNIFEAIDDNGQSQISYDAIIKIISFASSKMTLNRFHPNSQAKFFAFLYQYAKALMQQNQQKTNSLTIKLQILIKNNFIDFVNRQKFLTFLTESKIHITINLFYLLTIKNYNLPSALVQHMARFSERSMKLISYIKLIIAFQKMKAISPAAVQQVKLIQQIMVQKYSTPQKLNQLVKQFRNLKNQINLLYLHQIMSPHFAKLPNPFEQNSTDQAYRLSYLEYIIINYRSRDYTLFLQKYDQKITLQQLMQIISIHMNQQKQHLQPQRQLIFVLNRKHQQILQSNNKKWIELMFDFASKYNIFSVYRELEYGADSQLYKLMHGLINKIKIIQESKFMNAFSNLIEKFLSRKFKGYNNQYNYRNLLKHVISKIDYFQQKSRIMTVIIQEGLRLSLITPKSLQKLNINDSSFNYFDKLRLNYIKNTQTVAQVDRLTHASLKVILSNHNSKPYIIANQKRIIELISNSNQYQIFDYLVNFNQMKYPASSHIINEILAQSVLQKVSYERVNIIGCFNNAIAKNYSTYFGYHKLIQKIIEYIKNRIDIYSIETHMEIIKFICSQPTTNNREYYQNLVEYALKKDQIPDYLVNSLFVRLANSNYIFRDSDLKYLDRIIQKNPIQGLLFFLMVESKLSETVKSEAALKLSEFLTKAVKNQLNLENADFQYKYIPKVYYQYLKLQYPKQTEKLQITDQKCLGNYKFGFKSKNYDFLGKIAEQINIPLIEVTQFGQQNHLYRLGNYIFVFLSNKRIGGYYEHLFIKRFIPLILKQAVEVICLANSSQNSFVQYVNKQAPTLITPQSLVKLKELAQSRKLKQNKTVGEEEIVQE